MSVIAVARRYAEALADVAVERNQVETIESEINRFADMMRDSRELYDTFASPVVTLDDKGRVLDALIDRARPSQVTANLLRTMLRNYRLHHLDEVCRQFRREINDRRGVAIAQVTTAGPVHPAEQEMLSRKLQQVTGKQVQIEFKSDASIIGGVVTRIGSVVYDGSIRTQLEAVKQRLKE
jgi:F-type H+-transporting ATPase subunit delta